MSDMSPNPDTRDDVGAARPPRAPRWVKVFGIIVIVLILAFVILRLTGVGGQHGPGRHFGPARETPASGVTDHRPPPGIPNHGG